MVNILYLILWCRKQTTWLNIMKNKNIHTAINLNATMVKITGSVSASTRRLNASIIKSGKK